MCVAWLERRPRSSQGRAGHARFRVERHFTQSLERNQIAHLHPPPLEIDQPLAAQGLQHAVHVDRGNTDDIGKVILGQRHGAAILHHAVARGQPAVQLAQQVAQPLGRGHPAQVENPLFAVAQQGQHRVEHADHAVFLVRRAGLDAAVRQHARTHPRQRHDRQGGAALQQPLRLAIVAGKKQRDDLAPAIGQQAVLRRPAFLDAQHVILAFVRAGQKFVATVCAHLAWRAGHILRHILSPDLRRDAFGESAENLGSIHSGQFT